jgi:hypothetical protein
MRELRHKNLTRRNTGNRWNLSFSPCSPLFSLVKSVSMLLGTSPNMFPQVRMYEQRFVRQHHTCIGKPDRPVRDANRMVECVRYMCSDTLWSQTAKRQGSKDSASLSVSMIRLSTHIRSSRSTWKSIPEPSTISCRCRPYLLLGRMGRFFFNTSTLIIKCGCPPMCFWRPPKHTRINECTARVTRRHHPPCNDALS